MLMGNIARRMDLLVVQLARIEDSIFVFGDLDKIDCNGCIREFIRNRGLDVIDF